MQVNFPSFGHMFMVNKERCLEHMSRVHAKKEKKEKENCHLQKVAHNRLFRLCLGSCVTMATMITDFDERKPKS